MARSTTVPAAGNIARKSFAGEEKAKEEYYAEQLKKYGRLMVYSNKKKNGFYLIEHGEGGTVASRYTTDGGKIRQEAFDPKAMPASTGEATWRSRGLSLEESEQIKEKRSLSNRRKQWLDSVIEQAYEGQDKAEIANGVDDSMQFTDDLSNPVIYQDYRGTTLYMDFTGKAMENGEEQQLNQEEGSYLSQGLKNKWISFEGSLSKAEWQAVYEGVEEKYDNTPGFRPVNSVQKAAVLIYGKELTQGDLEKLGDLADSIKDDYDQDPNRFYKTDLNAKSIKGAYSYTELVAAGEVAAIPFKHKDLEQMAKKLENGEEEKARALMLEKFRQGVAKRAKDLLKEKAGQSPLDEMESFQKMEAAKEFKELAEKMENEMTEQKKTYQLPEKYKEDIDEKYWQQSGEQLDQLVKSDDPILRSVAACYGRDKDLDKLVNDKDAEVRSYVAEQGRDEDLDKLVHDSNLHVTQVARTQIRNRDLENLRHLQEEGKIKEGADLGKIADQLPGWRESNKRGDKLQLAKYGRDSDLDKLGRGESYLVRKTVALRGRDKDLDKLVDDPDWEVRKAVASQGRDKDLDKLVSDPDYNVRSSVASQGRDKDLDLLMSDKSRLVRSEVARQGRDKDLDKLVNDENAAVKMEVAKQERDKDLDKLVNDKSFAIREEIAKIGRDKDLDKLVSDKDEVVRAAVARQGRDKDLDKLVNDKASFVRSFVALQGRDKDLDKLVSDKSDLVRMSVAEYGRDKDLKKLARDKDSEVRMAVAEYGEYRGKLAKDKDPAVRDFVSQRRAADFENRRREAARQGLER